MGETETEFIKKLKSLGWNIKESWFNQVFNNGINDFDTIHQELLNTDISLSCEPHDDFLSLAQKSYWSLPYNVVLQVNEVVDISLPYEKRINFESSPKGTFKIDLSDGGFQLVGVTETQIPHLSVSIMPGQKIHISNNTVVCYGVFMLNEHNVQINGGFSDIQIEKKERITAEAPQESTFGELIESHNFDIQYPSNPIIKYPNVKPPLIKAMATHTPTPTPSPSPQQEPSKLLPNNDNSPNLVDTYMKHLSSQSKHTTQTERKKPQPQIDKKPPIQQPQPEKKPIIHQLNEPQQQSEGNPPNQQENKPQQTEQNGTPLKDDKPINKRPLFKPAKPPEKVYTIQELNNLDKSANLSNVKVNAHVFCLSSFKLKSNPQPTFSVYVSLTNQDTQETFNVKVSKALVAKFIAIPPEDWNEMPEEIQQEQRMNCENNLCALTSPLTLFDSGGKNGRFVLVEN
ncbi:recQ-mediated genome instability protein 1 [Histomonas meleagridis]|uniref:recQ-mediated genome instability protein 1 n=1 Tax=Histomonas meleagridis TaxID=135588 RepID=UPI0035599875|nr:recQ-mediated genome instability protein 1 [Histomonas meleagridis]KAH0799695.1 recQ-mediated genome instability protein 1 [Histomonas meleagridis]